MTAAGPEVGRRYLDRRGRALVVESLHPGDPNGREVRGTLTARDGTRHRYATALSIFDLAWRREGVP